MKRIGVIGTGSIGLRIIQAVEADIPNGMISGVLARSAERARAALASASACDIPVYTTLDKLLERDLDLVVEAAHPCAAQDCVKAVLSRGVDFMPMSVGGLLADEILREAAQIAQISGAELLLPCGAITGLNVAGAAVALRDSDLYEASVTSTKKPENLCAEPFFIAHPEIDPHLLSQRTVVFEGNVRQAVEMFPKNVNIAAALAISANDTARTKVRVAVAADPDTPGTWHHVSLKGAFGEMDCTLKLNGYPGGHSAYLAVLSAVAAVKKYCSPIKVGY